MIFYTVAQLAEKSGRSQRTIRHHIKQRWLKPEPKTPGVRGHRVNEQSANKWLSRHFPERVA